MQTTLAAETRFDERLLTLSSQMDGFEGYAHAHGLRVAEIADNIALRFNLAPRDCHLLQQASLLHDIGEVAMNRGYIRERRELTIEERLDLERHPVIGEQEAARLGLARGVQLLIRWHQEWWNGSGYPDKLGGEQIPFAARIIRVADSFSALTDDRPRRRAMTEAEAKQYMTEWAGIEFDPVILKAFFSLNYVIEKPSDNRQHQIESNNQGEAAA
ncbi:MAG: HD domain-containing protein [Acidobacteria bacterium]|nr:HD domain-containing protein [Acidobacteriota bacterium]MCA1608325.1 HD domain-containing protein [Acidobacteriota bacterium]